MTVPPTSLRFDTDLPLVSYFGTDAAVIPDQVITTGQVERIVALRGETAILARCISAEYDNYDSFDPGTAEWDLRPIKVIISSPSAKEARDIAGRGIDASKKATFGEFLKLRSDREGMGDLIVEIPDGTITNVSGSGSTWAIAVSYPDRVLTEGLTNLPVVAEYGIVFDSGVPTILGLEKDEYQIYRVQEVKRDRHPFVPVTKLSAYLQEVPGV